MKLIYCFLLILVIVACRDHYESPVNVPDKGYLVVEGFINTGVGPTSITITRMNKLNVTAMTYVRGAVVQVERDDNQLYSLTEKDLGVYSADQLNLDVSHKYRLRIRTPENKEYLSAFSAPRKTPAIDSISWRRDDTGVQIYVNTHDPKNETRYYRWEYLQTWEVHAPYPPALKYVITQVQGRKIYGVEFIDPVNQSLDTTRMRCWQHNPSTSILLGSTIKLTDDRISLPLIFIPGGSIAISILYSVLVKQYAVSKEEFEFLEIMRKNTELTGSVFDAQPSQLKGNIQTVSDASEPVIGFIGVHSLEEKRIFIRNRDVPDWKYTSGCMERVIENKSDSVEIAFLAQLMPTTVEERQGNFIVTFNVTESVCMDCTLRGTNKKPDFWP